MKILIVTEPLPGGHSVQFDLTTSIAEHLSRYGDVTLTSAFIHPEKLEEIARRGLRACCLPGLDRALIRWSARVLPYESMLWAASWAVEGFTALNGRAVRRLMAQEHFDFVINTSYTVPCDADVLWMQGPPLLTTLQGMAAESEAERLVLGLGRGMLEVLDRRVVGDLMRRSRKVVANSDYIRSVWSAQGVRVDGVVYSAPSLDEFTPTPAPPTRDYVLAYLGKEVEVRTLERVAHQGIPVIAFGSKVPEGHGLRRARASGIQLRRNVPAEELRELYSNALFTAFPFTNEPFGRVPLESMACGTPVLTYNREGPSETVVNGRTGWLVENPRDFVRQADRVWRRRSTGIAPEECVHQAARFSPQTAADQLYRLGAARGRAAA